MVQPHNSASPCGQPIPIEDIVPITQMVIHTTGIKISNYVRPIAIRRKDVGK
ncbi:MAG: hypothetical protein ACI9WS_001559 [Paraglaciecola psychrophila]|jgi:hypothetical protein